MIEQDTLCQPLASIDDCTYIGKYTHVYYTQNHVNSYIIVYTVLYKDQ